MNKKELNKIAKAIVPSMTEEQYYRGWYKRKLDNAKIAEIPRDVRVSMANKRVQDRFNSARMAEMQSTSQGNPDRWTSVAVSMSSAKNVPKDLAPGTYSATLGPKGLDNIQPMHRPFDVAPMTDLLSKLEGPSPAIDGLNPGQWLKNPINDKANPKDANGRAKLPLGLVPLSLTAETCLAFLEGKLKYGEVNWRATPVYASVYLDAARRHAELFAEGQDRDLMTKVHHLGNAAACFGIIIDAHTYGTLIDDRKLPSPEACLLLDSLKSNVAHLNDIFGLCNPKHYKITDAKNTEEQ